MIERLSSIAPKKDLQKYYLRDIIGQLVRICNDSLPNIFEYEYYYDKGGQQLANEYHIQNDDGWTFATTYLTRTLARSNNNIAPSLNELFDTILAHTLGIIHCQDDSQKQMKVNALHSIIKKYVKNNTIFMFANNMAYIVFEYPHESLLGYGIYLLLCLMIQNEYDPYSVCHIDKNGKTVYNYREINFDGGTICDFRDLNIEQSAEFSSQEKIDIIDSYYPGAKKTGSMSDFNAAYSFSMLRDINSKYAKAFQMRGILEAHRYMINEFVDLFVPIAARYVDNTYRLFQYTRIDPQDPVLTDYLYTNKSKWHIDLYLKNLTHEEIINLYYIEAIRRRLAFVMNNKFDVTSRSRLFTTGTSIKYTSQSRLLKNKDIEFFIYEYNYNSKFHLFISIKMDSVFNYYILKENDLNIFMQTYSCYDFLLLCAALYLINNESFDEYLTHKFENELTDIWVDETEKRQAILHVSPEDDHIPELIIEVLSEANTILSTSNNISEHKQRRITVSELYTEQVKFAPFLRKLPLGAKPSDEAIKLATQLKFTLPQGYTIVREHTRNIKKRG